MAEKYRTSNNDIRKSRVDIRKNFRGVLFSSPDEKETNGFLWRANFKIY